ncbi:60S acidic ribosomal protein P2 [Porphyridium purpureum]|uniref:60S acidic ribosomal protein P2 n=1 Tax=Porphyridium purpureum TaxID=35688 RepID=A0A5J4YWE1_PORPP|nr:60S acidic ribosomal protein P2 [Porphyridium purpureum]|eukprot:POR0463..scf227_4
MKYVAAYLLCALGGKASPSAEDVSAVLKSVGADVDKEALDRLITQMEGKSVEAALAEGSSKFAAVPSGGGAAPAGGAAAAPAAAAEAPAAAAAPAVEEEEEEAADFDLFD